MLGSKKPEAPTGAREKIEAARKLREAGHYNIKSAGKGGESISYPSQMIPVAVIYCLATILAMMLTDSNKNPLSGLHLTGSASLDRFITGTDVASFTGNSDEDRLLTVMGRGAAFFVIAAIIPALSLLFEKIFFYKRVMPLVVCWGVIIVVMLLYLCVPIDQIIPFIHDMVTGIVG